MTALNSARRVAICWGLTAALLVFAWQFLTVRYNYAGHWTGLFCIGGQAKLPPHLAPAGYPARSPGGYDGQFYRLVAHDPFLEQGLAEFMDGPVLRCRRVFVPLLAWLIAAGRERFIDGAYVAVVLAFIFLGTYWLSGLFARHGRHPAWGCLFLVVPATVVSIDRMTIDVALAALSAAFACCLLTESIVGLWFVLAAACLVRETGALLIAACVLYWLWRKEFRKAALLASAALPMLAWYAYVYFSLRGLPTASPAGVPGWFASGIGLGILYRLFDPPHYPLPLHLEVIARLLDSVALAGMLVALVLAIRVVRARPFGILETALVLHFGLFLLVNSTGFWITPYGYTRPFAPVFILLLSRSVLAARPTPLRWMLVSMALIDLRVATELKSQALGVASGLLGR